MPTAPHSLYYTATSSFIDRNLFLLFIQYIGCGNLSHY